MHYMIGIKGWFNKYRLIVLAVYCFIVSTAGAQDIYWLQFANKEASEFSLDNPALFMAPNALARRAAYDIPIERTDLPIPSAYIAAVDSFIECKYTSKWLNGMLGAIQTSEAIDSLLALPFVDTVFMVKTQSKSKKRRGKGIKGQNKGGDRMYGESALNIRMHGGIELHSYGFQGQGIEIAVMDNGFQGMDNSGYLAQARNDGRIVPVYDFVDDDPDVFSEGSHGSLVLGTMLGYFEGQMIGSAPLSKAYLFVTEDTDSEGLYEEYLWAIAAEHADSIMGIRSVINTSLGYSTGFDIADQNHTIEDMDGNTTPITIAADLAARKGFLVVNSAGNSGNDAWQYVTAPADGDSVLAVGATTIDGNRVSFSSLGPTADGRIKPDVMGVGYDVLTTSPYGFLTYADGTSFSSPLVSGLCASYWSAYPELTPFEILSDVKRFSHQFSNPDYEYGYGIPSFFAMYMARRTAEANGNVELYPNPIIEDKFNLLIDTDERESIGVVLHSISGQFIYEDGFNTYGASTIDIPVSLESALLKEGMFLVGVYDLQSGEELYERKVVIPMR
ncbi:MAG: S8 family serine peptidase [Bacteroidota bacterium]|nr:S8 family serine peptidase [Bacteroidota bacterium]